MQMSSHQGAVDIIIPVCNGFPYTRTLLEGVYRYTDLPFHIYLVDSGSTDETADVSKIYTRDITVVRNRENRGWCAGANQGVEVSHSPTVVFMSNDVEVSQGWLGNMAGFLRTHPRIGAVGPLSSNPSDWQGVDRVRERMVPQIPQFLTEDLHERNRILAHHFHQAGILVEGELAFFCTALQRRAINAVGPLDEECDNWEEDYCRRLRKAGYVLGLSLDTYLVHHGNGIQLPATVSVRRETRRPLAARNR
jgi:GT2 family glycosyltransferase